MIYITGIHALNIPCPLDTCGDWHRSALRWKEIYVDDSETSILGDYGITLDVDCSPMLEGHYAVANHIRALLDLLLDGNFAVAQGMRDDFICNEKYTPEILERVSSLQSFVDHELWQKIDIFMGKEYGVTWLDYKESRGL